MLFWTKNSRSDTMRNDAIGVFDSGMGGLTAVKELNAILPHENIIYFGDTARIPYGSRSPETVLRYAKEDVAFLRQYAVKMIIAACGTVSSIVGDQPFVTDMPFTGVVLPASETACRVTRNGKIGVIGTPATIRSGSYEKAIHKMHPEMTVFGQACPLFVHLVENGYTDLHNPVTRLVAEEYLEPVRKAGVDTLILGCTHYPLLRSRIMAYFGEKVHIVNPAYETAMDLKNILEEQKIANTSGEPAAYDFYVSDAAEKFKKFANSILPYDVDKTQAIDIEDY